MNNMAKKMNIEEFNKKYMNQGGFNQLTEMRALCFRTVYIAKHFDVSADTVRVWMNQYFGLTADPRQGRKAEIIKAMVEFSRFNHKDQFDFAYRGTEYYKEALQESKDKGIYA